MRGSKTTISTDCGPGLLRLATPEDETLLYRLFAHDRAAELAMAGLASPQIEGLIALQYRGQAMSYASAFPAARSWIVQCAEQPAARLLEVKDATEHYIIDIAVAPEHRRCGIAEGLLHWLMAQAKVCDLGVAAQIYRQNSASRSLFAKLGFQEASDREDPQVRTTWRSDKGCY